VLREDAGPPDEQQARHPQPGLDQLLALVDAARLASGATTRLIVAGTPAALDPGVELTAYRITQEALTNARRHAPGAPVDVELRFTDEMLRLRVRDAGPGPAAGRQTADPGSESTGHGVQGMRERAAAVGGRLQAGPSAAGGFVVEAELPAGAGQSQSVGGVL
jgi:signal transduction histidine kinase